MTLRELFSSRPSPSRAASELGRLGGRARAERAREPIKAKARQIREQCGLPADPRLA